MGRPFWGPFPDSMAHPNSGRSSGRMAFLRSIGELSYDALRDRRVDVKRMLGRACHAT
jgi:hypothetical protein